MRLFCEPLQNGFDKKNGAILYCQLLFLVPVDYHVLLDIKTNIFAFAICTHEVADHVIEQSLNGIRCKALNIGIMANASQVKIVDAFCFGTDG